MLQQDPNDTSTTANYDQIPSESPMPASFEAACEEASEAITTALSAGKRRLFIDLDTTNGDATYTTLKTSTPTVLAISRLWQVGRVQVVFPDAGAAALAKRDWEKQTVEDGNTATYHVTGIEQYEADENDTAVLVVVPRASEVEKLSELVNSAGDVPVIVVNPDLVDMGVTGLSLNARKLRTSVIDKFDSAYFLRVFSWGVLFRKYPQQWGIWVDDVTEACGFRCVTMLDSRPGTIQIEEILEAEFSASGDDMGQAVNPLSKALRGFQRFLSVYTKG